MSDMDKKILDHEEELKEQRKRPAPPRDDLDDVQPKTKRARKDPNSIDLLEKMAHGDKKLLVKLEDKGELDPLPELPPDEEEEDYYARGMRQIAENMKAGKFNNSG